MKVTKFLMVGFAPVVLSGALYAQQPTTTPTPTRQVQPGQNQPNQLPPGQGQLGQNQQRPGMMITNDQLAACLVIENQEEIQIAQFAKDKASDKAVKEFALMLADQHKQLLDAINKAAPQVAQMSVLRTEYSANKPALPTQSPTSQNQPNATSPNQQPNQPATAQRQAQPGGGSVDIVQLHREIADQCLSDAKAKLGQEKDAEFDKCFVGMQIAKHAAMQSKLTVIQRHATGELKNVIADGLEKTKQHLKVAEDLMEKIKDRDSSDSKKKSE
jgi:predicted outer membrane protein